MDSMKPPTKSTRYRIDLWDEANLTWVPGEVDWQDLQTAQRWLDTPEPGRLYRIVRLAIEEVPCTLS